VNQTQTSSMKHDSLGPNVETRLNVMKPSAEQFGLLVAYYRANSGPLESRPK
jgi:hypothetical protein